MICFRDRTWCASPDCKGDCGRKMTPELKAEAKKVELPISWGLFCGGAAYPEYSDIEKAICMSETISRGQHIQYCKDNAYAQYEFDVSGKEGSRPDEAIINACTTMICDLAKHLDTRDIIGSVALLAATVDSHESMCRFIDGFN